MYCWHCVVIDKKRGWVRTRTRGESLQLILQLDQKGSTLLGVVIMYII